MKERKPILNVFCLLKENVFFSIEIRITMSIVEDETAFLLKNENNRKRLLKSIEDAKAGKNLTTFSSLEELKEKYNNLKKN